MGMQAENKGCVKTPGARERAESSVEQRRTGLGVEATNSCGADSWAALQTIGVRNNRLCAGVSAILSSHRETDIEVILENTAIHSVRPLRSSDGVALQQEEGERHVSQVSDSGISNGTSIEVAGSVDVVEQAPRAGVESVSVSKWYRWRRDGKALVTYLLDSEVHTFSFSVAANAILSFIPFIVLLYELALSVFKWPTMVSVVTDMVNYFLPTHTFTTNWVPSAIEAAASHSSRHGVQALSLIMILISCTGIFLPLEVALNQAWGVAKSRNYLMNQTLAFGLAILMVALAVVCMFLNAGAQDMLGVAFLHHTDNIAFKSLSYVWMAVTTGVASIVFFFCIYWILPNRKVPWRPILRTSIYTGIVWLVAKLIFVAALPYLDLGAIYGPFYVSVGLLFWAYVSGLILFAGAQFSVARWGDKNGSESAR
jgi:membrane protein